MTKVRKTGGGVYHNRATGVVRTGDEIDVDEAVAERLVRRPDFARVNGEPDDDLDLEALSDSVWRRIVSAVEGGEIDGDLDRLHELETGRESPRDSVLEAIDARKAELEG